MPVLNSRTSVTVPCQIATYSLSFVFRCGNVGKLTRITATVSDPSFASSHPRKNAHAPFLVLGGFTDFILTSAFVNGHGAITGLANIAPVSRVVYQLLGEFC